MKKIIFIGLFILSFNFNVNGNELRGSNNHSSSDLNSFSFSSKFIDSNQPSYEKENIELYHQMWTEFYIKDVLEVDMHTQKGLDFLIRDGFIPLKENFTYGDYYLFRGSKQNSIEFPDYVFDSNMVWQDVRKLKQLLDEYDEVQRKIERLTEASKVVNEMRKKEEPYKNIIIAGGGKIGSRLAKRIELNHRVKIIESDHERAKRLSEKLEQTIVLEGNVCDKHLLHEENIEGTDVFAAVTNDDEANVMSCLLAKDMGAHKAVALINNPAYVDLVQDKGIDIAIAPSQITIGTFLAEIEGKDVVKVHSLRRGAAEAIEAVAKNSPSGKESSIGKELGEISLPEGATIGALIRDNKGKIAHDHVHLRENDHVIVFLTDKKVIKQVKETFSPA